MNTLLNDPGWNQKRKNEEWDSLEKMHHEKIIRMSQAISKLTKGQLIHGILFNYLKLAKGQLIVW